MSLARRAVVFVAATGLLLSAGVAAASPRAGDPRGVNRVYEAPGFSGDPNANVAALTFDDGPHPVFTPQILDILTAKGVKATFFLVGREAERHPDLVPPDRGRGPRDRQPHLGPPAPATEWTRSGSRSRSTTPTRSSSRSPARTSSASGRPTAMPEPDTVARLAAHGLTSIVWTADSTDFEKPGVDAIVATPSRACGTAASS